MSYSIYTLWGEPAWEGGPKQPVEVSVPDSLFNRPIWRVVVEREDTTGFVVQRDVTQGLTLNQALEQKENLVRIYCNDGFVTLNNLNFYLAGSGDEGGRTVIYLDVESEKSHAGVR